MRKISNQFAAMPSVHCAWALWCACALVPRLKHGGEGARRALPGLTVTAIVLTANHYFLDAVAGFIVLGLGYLVARDLHPCRAWPGARHASHLRSLRRATVTAPVSRSSDSPGGPTNQPITNPSSAEIAITTISGAVGGEDEVDVGLVGVEQCEEQQQRDQQPDHDQLDVDLAPVVVCRCAAMTSLAVASRFVRDRTASRLPRGARATPGVSTIGRRSRGPRGRRATVARRAR